MLAGGAAAFLLRAKPAAFVISGPVLGFGGGAVILGVTVAWLFFSWGRVFLLMRCFLATGGVGNPG